MDWTISVVQFFSGRYRWRKRPRWAKFDPIDWNTWNYYHYLFTTSIEWVPTIVADQGIVHFASLQTTDSDEHWPCFEAKFVDDLIVIPDVEQGEKLFRYVSTSLNHRDRTRVTLLALQGSFGKDEFARTKTQASPSAPLMKVPNNRKHYEKPYRLRSVHLDESK